MRTRVKITPKVGVAHKFRKLRRAVGPIVNPGSALVSQAICIFPRAHARGKGGGGREGKIRLVRCARFSFRLPECWQSQ